MKVILESNWTSSKLKITSSYMKAILESIWTSSEMECVTVTWPAT